MAVSLGEKLRQAREEKGLELRDVADNTRITIGYLAAIEDNNYKSLPGGVFNKGFVRSFAKAVGVDEREALADYNNLIATQLPEVDPNAPTRRPDVYTNEQQGTPLTKLFVALLVLGVIGAAAYFGLQYLQNRQTNAAQTAAPPEANANVQPIVVATTPTPTPQSLNVQIKAARQRVDLTAIVDGARREVFALQPDQTRDFTAQQSLKLSYSRFRAEFLQITINGKPAKASATSARANSGVAEMEITPDNLGQFVQ